MRPGIAVPSLWLVCVAVFARFALSEIEFIEHTIDDATHGAGGIYACDLDGDTDVDVLAASLEDNRILYWANSGTDPVEWTTHTIGTNVMSAHSVYAADIDLDDTLDVVGAAYYGSPGVAWWNNSGGSPIAWTKYPVAPSFTNAHEIYVHDLDRDGDSDILGASSDLNTISWWRNDRGTPVQWTEQTISDNVPLAKSVHVGDFNGDGRLDVVGAAITAHDVIWWRNDGGDPIQWTRFLIDGLFIGAHRVQAIDLDEDGDDDVLGAGYLGHQVAWWRNDGGDPVAWTKQTIGTGLTNACVAFATDLDGDGDSDVAVTAQGINQISWFENEGGSPIVWTKHVITNDFVRPWPLYACDLDGDDDIDIVAGSSHEGSNKVAWWENHGPASGGGVPVEPLRIDFGRNFPNPFADRTTIEFEYSDAITQATRATIAIVDVSGRTVRTLRTLRPESGWNGVHRVTWEGRDERGLPVAPGVYLYQLCTGDRRISGRMMKVR